MLGLSAAVVGLGVLVAAQNEEVKSAFKDMASYVGDRMKEITKPFVPVLKDAAAELKSAFQSIEPTLTRVFESGADLLGNLVQHIEPLATSIADMLEVGFEASAPVLDAFVGSLDEVFNGLRDMFRELSANGGSQVFAGFAEAFNTAVGDLLVVIGQLARALAPLGTVLLEVTVDGLERMGDYIEETLAPALEDMAYWVGENKDKVKAVLAGLAGLFVAIKVATAIGTLAGALSLLLTPAGLIVGVLGGIAYGLKYAWENSETFRDTVNGVITSVKEWWATNGEQIIENVMQTWQRILDFVSPIVQSIQRLANSVIATISEFWAEHGEDIYNTAVDTFQSVWDDIGPILRDIREIITTILDAITEDWERYGDDILNFMRVNFEALATIFRVGSTAIRAVMELLRAIVTGDWSQIRRNVVDTASRLWESVKDFFRTGKNDVVAKVREMVGDILADLATFPSRAAAAVGDLWDTLYNAGRELIGGFISGIYSRWQDVKNTLSYLTSLLPSWKGPRSKDRTLLTEAGELIMEGFQKGLESRYSDIEKSLGGFTTSLGKQAGADVPFSKGTKVSGGGTAIQVTVNVPPTADKAAVGKEIQRALDAYVRRGGRRSA